MKIIRDLVYDYIEIDEFEESIINTRHFQRLKDIRQLTAQHVFPSATHNRFEHSLGVFELSIKFFKQLRKVLKKDKFSLSEEELDKLEINLRIAALLHDVGHAPYSHLGERYYVIPKIKKEINDVLKQKNICVDQSVFSKGAGHEIMSCYIILKYYSDIIKSKTENYELICRCITGVKYTQGALWKENLIIELLNSSTIDIDKLDYLVRDAIMTRAGVPPIDVNRLARNINVNPSRHNVTFNVQAIPVLQNIIEARDSMYLWVYNHHITVYTDFLMEFFLKHLIVNYESKNRYSDKLNPDDYFSCKAIGEELISDSELYGKLKQTRILSQTSAYTQKISPQLFERKFLKPLWKTIYEYKQFMTVNVPDIGLRKELQEKMCNLDDYDYRRYLAIELIHRCNLSMGDIFIVPRSNKFYSYSADKIFTVFINEGDKDIGDLLPQKQYDDFFDKVAFYVFVPETKKVEVEEALIDIVKYKLPDKEELAKTPKTELDWLKY
ncbi:MAG: HD domain-containing protein [Acholeplasmataceae bacterium]|nr:HD domain-containing protein [Acholeplasmataceae bacterium]